MSNAQERTIPEDVMVAHLEGEAVILNVQTKKYYQLNETAAAIWRQLEQGRSDDEIVDALVESFEVDAPTARTELERMLTELEQKELIGS